MPADLFSLLDGMLKKLPKERMTLDDVFSHCWTHQPIDLDTYSFEDIVPCGKPTFGREKNWFLNAFVSRFFLPEAGVLLLNLRKIFFDADESQRV